MASNEKASEASASTSSSSEVQPFKRPPSPSQIQSLRGKRKQKVLSEDDYVAGVEKIIERDFFPELEKMRAQEQYLRAVDGGDVGTMRRLEERYSSGNVPRLSDRMQSPMDAGWDTPQEVDREKAETDRDADKDEGEGKADGAGKDKEEDDKKGDKQGRVGLDAFLARHTSEDNDSFNEIQEEQFKRFRLTHAWMFKDEEARSREDKTRQLALPGPEGQAALERESGEEATTKPLDTWTYKNVNAVFYNPDGTPFTKEEELDRQLKMRSIQFENTRFQRNPWKGDLQKDSLNDKVHAKKTKEAGRVGVDGKAAGKPATPQVGGFSLLKMASPSPLIHPSESPLMTWGEVESTPYRLEGCDTPMTMHSAGGPAFKMQEMPKRDRLAKELAEKNSKFYRDRKGKAIHKARCNIKSPSGSLTERVAGMSPAARRLASSKLGIRLGTDKGLHAAYTPSPLRTPKSAAAAGGSQRSLLASTVRSAKGGSTPRTPLVVPKKASTPARAGSAASESLDTDNLLNLPAAGRKKASDFL